MRKYLIIFMLFVLSVLVCNKHVFAVTGDIDGDGKVNIIDKEYLEKYINEQLSDADKEKVEKKGDINGDGKITTKDITEISSLMSSTGDINGDGKIDETDKEFIKKYINEQLSESDKEKVESKGDLNHDGKISTKDMTEVDSIMKRGSSVTGRSDATSCAGFHTPNSCKLGQSEGGSFGCVWNEKYEFCSPNGLVYLSCGDSDEKNENAHDIPEMVPRLVSYFIVILKTSTPIILIIMGMVQIIKAIANSNEDEIKKAKSSLIKKLIAAVLVFFSISIVQFVVDQVVDNDEKGSLGACLNCFINNNCGDTEYYVDGYGKCYYISDKYSAVDCETDIGSKVNNQFLN